MAILRAEANGAGLAPLDSLVRSGPLGNVLTEAAASLALARGLAARGDTAAAFSALEDPRRTGTWEASATAKRWGASVGGVGDTALQ